tara:strand:+ start:32207 stop:32458 length:252 start_codon:yes stop_codon:yes gene_type:complete
MGVPAWRFLIRNEDLSSQIDGENRTFSITFPFSRPSLQVFRNGQKILKSDNDDGYSILTATSIRLNFIPANGEKIEVIYTRRS